MSLATTATTERTARLEQIREREAAASGQEWHWAGNVDSGEPYLATWLPGQGRCMVMALGHEERSTTGAAADRVRSSAEEFGYDPDELVRQWATDGHGEPMRDARLELNVNGYMVHARDRAIFEVAPNATRRDDPAVYRGDVTGIRHPDAQLIAHSRGDIKYLLDELADAEATIENLTATVEHDGRYIAGADAALCEVERVLREEDVTITRTAPSVTTISDLLSSGPNDGPNDAVNAALNRTAPSATWDALLDVRTERLTTPTPDGDLVAHARALTAGDAGTHTRSQLIAAAAALIAAAEAL